MKRLKKTINKRFQFLRIIFLDLIFFLLKGLRMRIWMSKILNMGGKGIKNLNYANIADQMKFINTMKFYQETLSSLAKSAEKNERENIKKSVIVFLEAHPKYSFKYNLLSRENKMWVIDYLSSGKGVIPHESIKTWEDLNKSPPLNIFFPKTDFYGSLKNSTISDEEYEKYHIV